MSTPATTPRGSRRSCYGHVKTTPEPTSSTTPRGSRRSEYGHVKTTPEPTSSTKSSSRASPKSGAKGRTASPTPSFVPQTRSPRAQGTRHPAQEPKATLDQSLKNLIPCMVRSEDVIDSTAASSACESLHDKEGDNGDPSNTSSRVLFAKASELIRVEIAGVERRLIARVEMDRADRQAIRDQVAQDVDIYEKRVTERIEKESSERKAACDKMQGRCDKMAADLSEMVGVLENLSTNSESKFLGALEKERRVLDSLLEEERGLRDMACASLLGKLETIALQVCDFQNIVDSIHGLLNQEKQTNKALEASFQSISGELMAQKNQRNPLVDDQYMKALLDRERQTHDLAYAKLRTEVRKELEDMSMEVRGLVVRAPLYDSLERQQRESELVCMQLRDDIDKLFRKTNLPSIGYQ